MINLLPLEEKKKLVSVKRERAAIIYGIVVLVFLVCLALVLLSIKFYLLSETDYQKNILQQSEKETQTAEFMNLNGTVKKYDVILSQLDAFYKKEIYFGDAMDIISNVSEPAGLHLINFSLAREADGTLQVNVAGTSDTRDNLLIFRQSIESDASIKNPYFSPDSWIAQKNVNFSLTFTIDQNEKQQQ